MSRGTRRWAIAAAAGATGAALLLGGYAGGRRHLVGRWLRPPPPEAEKPWDALLLDADLGTGATAERYRELNAFLDARLEARFADRHRWRSVLEAGDAAERATARAALRDALVASLGDDWPGPALPLSPELGPAIERPGLSGRIVHLTTHPGVRLTCAVLLPPRAEGPAPALLVLHGMYGGLDPLLDDVDYHHGMASTLARAGYVVIAPLRVAATIDARNTLWVKTRAAGGTLRALELWQLRRALDYAATLPEVDPARIGVAGISLGGQQALWLAALDARIAAVVSVDFFTDRVAWLYGRRGGDPGATPAAGWAERIVPEDTVLHGGEGLVELDDLNLVALIHPRPLALVSGTRDPRHPGAVARFEDVARLYTASGDRHRVELIPYEGSHEARLEPVLPYLARVLTP